MKRLLLAFLMLSACSHTKSPPAPAPDLPITAAAIGDTVGTSGGIRIGHSNKCLDIASSGTADFTRVQQWDCNGTGAQSFRMNDVGGGWFELQNTNSNKCLDAQGGSTAPGTPFVLYRCTGPAGWNQHFRVDNGMLRVRHGSNLCLDVKDWGQANGTPIIQWTCGNGQANQKFAINGNGGGSSGNGGGGGQTPPPSNGNWRLVWEDNFDGNGDVDRGKWQYEVWRPGTVNNERQAYTDNRRENVRVNAGVLTIEARRDGFGGEFSSGRIKTQGKASFTYGKIEARIKLPGGGKGSWPAFWMMPDNQSRGWPACGEIDIMEWVSFDPGLVHGTVHTAAYNHLKGTQKEGKTGINPGEWHTYSIEWFPNYIAWYVDGREYHRFNNEGGDDKWPYNKPFHIILNFAVGGDWGGCCGFDYDWPRQMQVDWVRVYQR